MIVDNPRDETTLYTRIFKIRARQIDIEFYCFEITKKFAIVQWQSIKSNNRVDIGKSSEKLNILLRKVLIDFINLSISRYMYRIKEIGIRKVSGASKPQLILQFLAEN